MGRLWNEGVNRTVDVAVFRKTKEAGTEVLVIKRWSGEWALPGGFKENDSAICAARRELREEAFADTPEEVFFPESRFFQFADFRVDDPRNEEDRWIETTLFVVVVKHDEKLQPRAGDDAHGVKWLPVNSIDDLYANHKDLVLSALKGVVPGGNSEVEKVGAC